MYVAIRTIWYISINNLDGAEFVDDNYFVDLLALCAFEIPYREPQPSPVEKVKSGLIKILFFVEKLSQTEGTNKILIRSGSTRYKFIVK